MNFQGLQAKYCRLLAKMEPGNYCVPTTLLLTLAFLADLFSEMSKIAPRFCQRLDERGTGATASLFTNA